MRYSSLSDATVGRRPVPPTHFWRVRPGWDRAALTTRGEGLWTTLGAVKSCPHPTCLKEIPDDRFACTKHWYQLPVALRTKVWTDYVHGDLGEIFANYDAAQEYWAANR